MRRGRGSGVLAAALLGALLLPGCLAPSGTLEPRQARVASNGEDAECVRFAQARWLEPGLARRALEGRAPQGSNVTISTFAVPRASPVRVPEAAERWPGSSLTMVAWRPSPDETAWLEWFGEHVVFLFETGDPPERRVALLGALLDAAGVADHPSRPAWEEAVVLLAVDERGSNQLPLGELRVDGAAVGAALARHGDAAIDADAWTGAMLRAGALEARFALPGVVVASPDATLVVDPEGRAHVEVVMPASAPEWPTVQARVSAMLAEVGVSPPTYDRATGGSRLVC